MAGRAPIPVLLSDGQKTILESIVRREKSPQRLVRRAQIILACAEWIYNQTVAVRVGVSRYIVRVWRERWLSAQEKLKEVESSGKAKELLFAIEETLADAPGRGAKPKFSAEQICQIVAVACEKPEDSERPISHWSQRELTEEVMKREIVEKISPRQVGRFLKRSRHQTSLVPLLAESEN